MLVELYSWAFQNPILYCKTMWNYHYGVIAAIDQGLTF